MSNEHWKVFLDKFLDELRYLSDTKGKEYAHSDNRFANFSRLAAELDISREKIAYIFFKKHLDAIISYLKEGRTFSEEGIRGRYLDATLYLILMAGMDAAAQEKEQPKRKEQLGKLQDDFFHPVGCFCWKCMGEEIKSESWLKTPGVKEQQEKERLEKQRFESYGESKVEEKRTGPLFEHVRILSETASAPAKLSETEVESEHAQVEAWQNTRCTCDKCVARRLREEAQVKLAQENL